MQIQHNNHHYDDTIKRQALDDAFKPKRTHEPTETELCETVVLLKRIMPHRSLQRAISMLYQTLIKRKSPSEVFTQPIPINYGQIPVSSNNKTANSNEGVSKTYSKEELTKTKFPNEQEQFKYKEKRLVAKSFVAKGYGHEHANLQLSKAKFTHTLTKQVYKPLISSVITQAFRRLQSFLIEDCHKRISPIMKQQMKKAMKPLLSSTALGQSNVTIFKKYLRLIFGLSAVTINESQSIILYLSVMKQIFDKQLSMQQIEAGLLDQQRRNGSDLKNLPLQQVNHQNKKDQSILRQKEEDKVSQKADCIQRLNEEDLILIQCYLQLGSLTKILQQNRHKFMRLNTIYKMQKRLFQMISLVLRKIKMQLVKNPSEAIQFPKFDQRQLNLILCSTGGAVLRRYLLQYYKCESYQRNRVVKIVNGLKELMVRDREKDEMCASLMGENSSLDQIKIQQNIKIEQTGQN